MLEFSYTARNVMRLEAFSPLAQIIRRAGYQGSFPPTQGAFARLHRDVQTALRSGHPEWISADRLHVLLEGRECVVKVDLQNTQFIGADLEVSNFRLGYEPEILMCIDALVPDDGVLVDVGANWGYFPIYLYSRTGFRGRCLAVEPSDRAYRDLVSVIGAIGASERILAMPLAMGDHPAVIAIQEELWTGNNKVAAPTAGGKDGDTRQKAFCETLDAVMSRVGYDALHVLKIDVEGAEAAVIRGAAETINKYRPTIIFESWLEESEDTTLLPFRTLTDVNGRYLFYVAEPRQTSDDRSFSGQLRQIQPAERPLLPARINVIAVPDDELIRSVAAYRPST
ncbi:MAG: FkbM family methyltransferase [Ancalomicrobiaceae bacterium]|nr:FkbM family methyltransferase [Ancalomicrobiaceae bacterium]